MRAQESADDKTTAVRGISVMGSTGSIGAQTLEIIRRAPERFRVLALSAGKNLQLLRQQIKEFRPALVSTIAAADGAVLKSEFPEVEFVFGDEGNVACVEVAGVHTVVMGIVGFAALKPTLIAVERGKCVALANKESLVVAGNLFRKAVAGSAGICIPVDSEHNALYQLLAGRDRNQVESVVLTASGGPLLKKPDFPLADVTPAMAIDHPNWKMGPKISVDSATLMNKGLEVIEAHYLFDFPADKIEVWVHPQSILHGAIWLKDNSCLAQLSKPDMKSSIGFALAFPERISNVIPKMSFGDFCRLEFLAPDERRFPALSLCRAALNAGPAALVTLNAANEIAVQSFLEGKILFPEIPRTIERALTNVSNIALETVEAIFDGSGSARHDHEVNPEIKGVIASNA